MFEGKASGCAVGLVLVLGSVTGCRPASTPSTTSIPSMGASVIPASPEPSPSAMPDETLARTAPSRASQDAAAEPAGLSVTVSSQCAETWNGLHRRVQPDQLNVEFEVERTTPQELSLAPGDSLLLTTPFGGILDVTFDERYASYRARVEINAECTGVRRSYESL